MVQAGARPIDWMAVTGEWAPDYTGAGTRRSLAMSGRAEAAAWAC